MLTGSAATRTRDWGWIHTSLPDSIIRHDVTNDFDSLTLVGPKAATAVQSFIDEQV
jgi:glycine cleavage system aminomethyltransferase T